MKTSRSIGVLACFCFYEKASDVHQESVAVVGGGEEVERCVIFRCSS